MSDIKIVPDLVRIERLEKLVDSLEEQNAKFKRELRNRTKHRTLMERRITKLEKASKE